MPLYLSCCMWCEFVFSSSHLLYPWVRARSLSPVAGTLIHFVVYFASFLVYRRILLLLFFFFHFVVHLSRSPHSHIIVSYVWLTRVYIFGRVFSFSFCGGRMSSYILFSFSSLYKFLFYDRMHMCSNSEMKNEKEKKKIMQNYISITKFLFLHIHVVHIEKMAFAKVATFE